MLSLFWPINVQITLTIFLLLNPQTIWLSTISFKVIGVLLLPTTAWVMSKLLCSLDKAALDSPAGLLDRLCSQIQPGKGFSPQPFTSPLAPAKDMCSWEPVMLPLRAGREEVIDAVWLIHGLKGQMSSFFVFVSFVFWIWASLLTCSRPLSYRPMNVRVARGGHWYHLEIFDA